MTRQNAYSWEDDLRRIQNGDYCPEEGQLIKAVYQTSARDGTITKEVGVVDVGYPNRMTVVEAIAYGSFAGPNEMEYRLHRVYWRELREILRYRWTTKNGTKMHMVNMTIYENRMERIKHLLKDMGLFGLIARMRLL